MITARLLRESDIEPFSEWATDNIDIPSEDKRMLGYPSALTIAVEEDGKPVFFIPLQIAVQIGFLNFSPELTPLDKARVLREGMKAAKGLCKALEISEIHVATKPKYPMGKWAIKHGFKDSGKNDLYLEVNHV